MSAVQNRWSRRRAAVQAEAEADTKALDDAVVAQERAALEEKTDAEILAELELQDPDEMGAGDDFSGFMKAAVPEHLRRRALRKLWRTNPVLANVDNLVDYGEDFAAEAKLGGVIKTAYQVGKGMLKHVEEMANQDAEEATDDQNTEPEQEVPELELTTDQDVPDNTVAPEPPLTPLTDDGATDFTIRRKMRFEFAS
ncbi:MAG: DUF3306 domain-containing protein [Marinosulfonomonas sp.]|nr:DUF3306 domain-containing protein [Marinosulfonomonas sp.]